MMLPSGSTRGWLLREIVKRKQNHARPLSLGEQSVQCAGCTVQNTPHGISSEGGKVLNWDIYHNTIVKNQNTCPSKAYFIIKNIQKQEFVILK